MKKKLLVLCLASLLSMCAIAYTQNSTANNINQGMKQGNEASFLKNVANASGTSGNISFYASSDGKTLTMEGNQYYYVSLSSDGPYHGVYSSSLGRVTVRVMLPNKQISAF